MSGAEDDAWAGFHRRWARLKPPLRANGEVVAAIGEAIAGHEASVLLLGVTPELADLGAATIALDFSDRMITHIWPGDTSDRRAVLGDWRAVPFETPHFSAAIGDGNLNALDYSDYPAVFAELERVLTPGARLAIRLYETPAEGETVEVVRQAAFAGHAGGFHGFKWRFAMAIAAERDDPSVPIADIHAAFQRAFPDRAALAQAAGWAPETVDEIDAYAGSATRYSFPTRRQLLTALPPSFTNPRFAPSGAYDLAERCPIFVADFEP